MPATSSLQSMFPPQTRGGVSSGCRARAGGMPDDAEERAAARARGRAGQRPIPASASSAQWSATSRPRSTPSRSLSGVCQPPACVTPQSRPEPRRSGPRASAPPAHRAPRPARSARGRRRARRRGGSKTLVLRRRASRRSRHGTRSCRPSRPSGPARGRARSGRAAFAARAAPRGSQRPHSCAESVKCIELRRRRRRGCQLIAEEREDRRVHAALHLRPRAAAVADELPRRSRASRAPSCWARSRARRGSRTRSTPQISNAVRVRAAVASVAKPARHPALADPVADLQRTRTEPRV